jgi:hypothetical protein
MIQLALYNGNQESKTSWYRRAGIPREIGYWNVEGSLISTKIEVAFIAPEYVTPRDTALDANGWAILVPGTDVPLFFGSLPNVRLAAGTTFCIQPRMSLENLTIDEKFVTYWALFNTPRLNGHDRTLVKMLDGVQAMLCAAKTVDQIAAEDKNISIN